ncbi:MAG: DoxX family membrane protein [Mucilaginibacter polytrichastri]|nr:DoxX family membrane protein [Mucilaginibacter polytrichastri]
MAFFCGLLFWLGVFQLIALVFGVHHLRTLEVSARYSAAVMFALVGFSHMFRPERLDYMVPKIFPNPRFWVYLTGVLEIVFGIGLLFSPAKIACAWGLLALLVMVFPANINVAARNLPPPGGLPAKQWYVWTRLFFQPLYMAWIWFAVF